MNNGYVKLYRKHWDSGMLKNPEQWALYCYLLFRAAHKPRIQDVRGRGVELQRGQLIFGRKKAAEELHSTERKVRTGISALDRKGLLTVSPSNRFSIVTMLELVDRSLNGDLVESGRSTNILTSFDEADRAEIQDEKRGISVVASNKVTKTLTTKQEDIKKRKNIVGMTDDGISFCKKCSEIIDHLNMKCGAKFRPTTRATQRLIKARLNEGFDIEDFKSVIDSRFVEWGSNGDMRQYLRPTTLFGPKFEGYLQAQNTRIQKPINDCFRCDYQVRGVCDRTEEQRSCCTAFIQANNGTA